MGKKFPVKLMGKKLLNIFCALTSSNLWSCMNVLLCFIFRHLYNLHQVHKTSKQIVSYNVFVHLYFNFNILVSKFLHGVLHLENQDLYKIAGKKTFISDSLNK